MKRKIIKPINMILACITAFSMLFVTSNNVFAVEKTTASNLANSREMLSSLKDATYLGVTDPDDDLISYRLQVTMKGGKITKASFYMCFDGCEYTASTTNYLLNNQVMGMKNPERRARYELMDNTFNEDAIAAKSYNEKLIGLSNTSELPRPSTNKEVYAALQTAWKNIIKNRLIVVEHRDESIGDNNNITHSWNEYIPKFVQEHPNVKVPMVMVLHASGNNIEQAEGWGFPYVGAKENFITVIPSSTTPGIWSEPNSKSSPYNDEEYLLKLINNVEKHHSINKQKIYMAGISLGATMTADMGLLHPEIFSGIDVVAGGPSINTDTVSSIENRLSQGLTRLPIIFGVGTDDGISFPNRDSNSKPSIRTEYDPFFNEFKKMNNISIATFDSNYIFGAPLNNSETFEKYGYTINTGDWYSNDNLQKANYMMMCAINEMWHSNPNPYYAEMSWNYLNKFSRKADGTLIQNNCANR